MSGEDTIKSLYAEYQRESTRIGRFKFVRILLLAILTLAVSDTAAILQTRSVVDKRARLDRLEHVVIPQRMKSPFRSPLWFLEEEASPEIRVTGNSGWNEPTAAGIAEEVNEAFALTTELDREFEQAALDMSVLGARFQIYVGQWLFWLCFSFVLISPLGALMERRRRLIRDSARKVLSALEEREFPAWAFSDDRRGRAFLLGPSRYFNGLEAIASLLLVGFLAFQAIRLRFWGQNQTLVIICLLATAFYYAWLWGRCSTRGMVMSPEESRPSILRRAWDGCAARLRFRKRQTTGPFLGAGSILTLLTLFVATVPSGCFMAFETATGLEYLSATLGPEKEKADHRERANLSRGPVGSEAARYLEAEVRSLLHPPELQWLGSSRPVLVSEDRQRGTKLPKLWLGSWGAVFEAPRRAILLNKLSCAAFLSSLALALLSAILALTRIPRSLQRASSVLSFAAGSLAIYFMVDASFAFPYLFMRGGVMLLPVQIGAWLFACWLLARLCVPHFGRGLPRLPLGLLLAVLLPAYLFMLNVYAVSHVELKQPLVGVLSLVAGLHFLAAGYATLLEHPPQAGSEPR